LALAESTGERMYEAEVCRLLGDSLLTTGRHGVEAADACFERALALARRQGARSLELRAATSLVRFRQDRANDLPARDVILPIYEQFEEGFDTLDLRSARDLIAQCAER
jgi:predicted ATPase